MHRHFEVLLAVEEGLDRRVVGSVVGSAVGLVEGLRGIQTDLAVHSLGEVAGHMVAADMVVAGCMVDIAQVPGEEAVLGVDIVAAEDYSQAVESKMVPVSTVVGIGQLAAGPAIAVVDMEAAAKHLL